MATDRRGTCLHVQDMTDRSLTGKIEILSENQKRNKFFSSCVKKLHGVLIGIFNYRHGLVCMLDVIIYFIFQVGKFIVQKDIVVVGD